MAIDSKPEIGIQKISGKNTDSFSEEKLQEQFADFPEIKVYEKGDITYVSLSTDNIDYVGNPKFHEDDGVSDKKLGKIGEKFQNQYPNYHCEGITIGPKDDSTNEGLKIVISLSKKTDQLKSPSTSGNVVSK